MIGVAGEDYIQAGYALAKFLKEAGNYEHSAVEFTDMKRWVDIYLYDYPRSLEASLRNEPDTSVGVGFTIFRERWNGSLYNINIPLVYAALEAPQREGEYLTALWDITLRRINPSVRCYERKGTRLEPLDIQVPQLMTEPR